MSGFSVFQNVSSVQHFIHPISRRFKTLFNKIVGQEIKEVLPIIAGECASDAPYIPYIAIAPENKWKVQMITRWKQLNDLSQEKIENLHIYVPSEEVPAFKQLIKNHQIQAIICPTNNVA